MFTVQYRVAGSAVDEERCDARSDARDALERRRRRLLESGAQIVAEHTDSLVARTRDGWAVVTITQDWFHEPAAYVARPR